MLHSDWHRRRPPPPEAPTPRRPPSLPRKQNSTAEGLGFAASCIFQCLARLLCLQGKGHLRLCHPTLRDRRKYTIIQVAYTCSCMRSLVSPQPGSVGACAFDAPITCRSCNRLGHASGVTHKPRWEWWGGQRGGGVGGGGRARRAVGGVANRAVEAASPQAPASGLGGRGAGGLSIGLRSTHLSDWRAGVTRCKHSECKQPQVDHAARLASRKTYTYSNKCGASMACTLIDSARQLRSSAHTRPARPPPLVTPRSTPTE